MDSPIHSSFIPHDATKVSANYAVKRSAGGAGELLLLIAIVFLVASAALAGGVFLYKQYLETARKQKADDLVRAKAQFEPSLIDQLTKLDRRMQGAQTILAQHIAPSVLFDALEASTLTTVSFVQMQFAAQDAQHISVNMDGIAQSVNSVALQAQTFGKNSVITDPIFSAINRDIDGVHFKFTGIINPSSLNYAQLANSAVAAQATQQQGPQMPQTVFNNNTGQGAQHAPQGQTPQASPSH